MRVNQPQQFVVHGVGLFFSGRPQRLTRAVMQVILHQVARDAAQRLLHRGDLGDDVGAVAVILDHFLQAADLPFDAAQPLPIAFLERLIDRQRFVAGAHLASAVGRCSFPLRPGAQFGRHGYIPSRGIYTPAPYLCQARAGARDRMPGEAAILPGMTLMEIRYALESPLTLEQLHSLSEFANTYGLRKFRLNDARTELAFEYDASRLRETQVVHALGLAKIAVVKKLN